MSHQSLEPGCRLSMQEDKVLQLLASGLSNKGIAARMGISLSTVKRHVENIFRKIQVKNRVEAAVYAVRTGTDESETIRARNSKQDSPPIAGQSKAQRRRRARGLGVRVTRK